MGKVKKQKNRRHKENPTGLPSEQDIEKEDENLEEETTDQTIERVTEQLSSVNMEEKLSGIQTLEAMSCNQAAAILVSGQEIMKILGPLLIDQSDMVRAATASAFRSIADNGGEEAVTNLLKNDIVTPLAVLLKRHYSSWRPNASTPNKPRKGVDYEKETFLQAVTLLWTLAEKNDVVLKRTEEEDLLTVLLPFLDTQIYDLETSIVAIQCILTLSEENLFLLEQIQPNKDHVLRLFDLETSDALNEAEVLMLRTLAAGLIINLITGIPGNDQTAIIGKCLTLLSKTLSCDYDEQLEKVVALLDKEKSNVSSKTVRKLKHLKVLVNAQIQAVEILANVCADQDCGASESSFDSENELDPEDDEMMDQSMEGMEMTSHLSIEAIEAIVAEDLVRKILNRTRALPGNVGRLLGSCDEGALVCKRLHTLRCRSYLCLTNFILNLNCETLGVASELFRIWSETGKLVVHDIDANDVELMDAATSLMRAAIQKINELQANPFQQMTLDDLQPMLTGERRSPSPNVRANLINILGSLSLILVKSSLESSGELIKSIADFLINSCNTEPQVWVIAEALDTVMDIFAEDVTDKLALEVNLTSRLKNLSSVLQTKFRQQKQTLGPNMAIVSTVKVNLARFLKYKERRISLLRCT